MVHKVVLNKLGNHSKRVAWSFNKYRPRNLNKLKKSLRTPRKRRTKRKIKKTKTIMKMMILSTKCENQIYGMRVKPI